MYNYRQVGRDTPCLFFLFCMNAIIEDKLDEIYSIIMTKPNQILEIFNNFFGEDRVDMQGFPSIEEFKNWMMSEFRLGGFAPRDSSVYNEDSDYYDYRYRALFTIPEEKCIEILNSTSIVSIVSIITEANIFNDGFILVHFPHVRITNEYDKFVDINHLYAKVKILVNGAMNGYFALNRAEYSYLHISNDYMHSHVNYIPTWNFTDFQVPCTGSGPINGTISNLIREYDPDIWELFCLELSKYVEVESIEGIPYHRLENIGSHNRTEIVDKFTLYNYLPSYYGKIAKPMFKDFTSHFIKQGKLKFDYKDGSYSIGMSFTDYMLTISNEFIDWYNEKFRNGKYGYTLTALMSRHILRKYIIANGKLYDDETIGSMESFRRYVGIKICTFKGRDVLLNITDIGNIGDNSSTILDIPLALYILAKILKVINYRYGKSKHTDSEGNPVNETIRYI